MSKVGPGARDRYFEEPQPQSEPPPPPPAREPPPSSREIPGLTDRVDAAARPAQPAPSMGKRWNYIFTVGMPSSGKSTLQRHLMLYLQDHYSVFPPPDAPPGWHAYRNLELEWNRQKQRGEFPKRTAAESGVTDFRVIVQPAGAPEFPFGFLEITGEEFAVLTQPSEKVPTLRSVNSYLRDPDLSLLFLFVIRGHNVADEDVLFRRFLDYLQDEHVRRARLIARCSVAIVLADPELCRERLAKWRQVRGEKEPLDTSWSAEARAFVDAILRQTSLRLRQSWGDRAAIAWFSVGKVGDAVDPATGQMGKNNHIDEWSYDDTQDLFHWLYEQFTGRSLGPGPMTRALNWLRGND